jgi:carbamoylphosphate synthase large subunit
MRIAFLRSVDVRQAFPALPEALRELTQAGHEVALFVVDDQPELHLEHGTLITLEPDCPVPEIARQLAAWKPDRVVSISIPDDKALRDACIAVSLRATHDIDVVMHPLAVTHAFANKWATRQLVEDTGLAAAPGFLISGDLLCERGVRYGAYRDYVSLMLTYVSFPVVCKPIWDSMAQGIQKFATPAELEDWLDGARPEADLIIEEYLDGELFGIEVVGRDGTYVCQPLVRKCLGTGEDLVPFNHIRFGPVADDRYNLPILQHQLTRLAAQVELCGSAEFELMWFRGRFHVIEVNPRVSGMTNLSSAISGVNTYTALASTITPAKPAPQFIVEVPLDNMDENRRLALEAHDDVIWVQGVTYHDGSSQWKALIVAPDAPAAADRLHQLDLSYSILPDGALDELRYALETEDAYV